MLKVGSSLLSLIMTTPSLKPTATSFGILAEGNTPGLLEGVVKSILDPIGTTIPDFNHSVFASADDDE